MGSRFNEQVEDVYQDLGNAYDSGAEEDLEEMQEMQSMARGGARRGGGGGGGAAFGSAMMQESAMAMNSMTEVSAMRSSAAPKQKNRSTAITGGKKRLNDKVSTKLY